jgi:DHA2 family methylenomycin A resistance protein-like MFS transporter
MALLLLALAWAMPEAPFGLLLAVIVVMNLGVGVAIPAMTASSMQVAGKAHANSAAAALNANRQIGALVGVALMGSLLHALPGWDERLPAGFMAVALAFASAWRLV